MTSNAINLEIKRKCNEERSHFSFASDFIVVAQAAFASNMTENCRIVGEIRVQLEEVSGQLKNITSILTSNKNDMVVLEKLDLMVIILNLCS
jgi:hypothetical protein